MMTCNKEGHSFICSFVRSFIYSFIPSSFACTCPFAHWGLHFFVGKKYILVYESSPSFAQAPGLQLSMPQSWVCLFLPSVIHWSLLDGFLQTKNHKWIQGSSEVICDVCKGWWKWDHAVRKDLLWKQHHWSFSRPWMLPNASGLWRQTQLLKTTRVASSEVPLVVEPRKTPTKGSLCRL